MRRILTTILLIFFVSGTTAFGQLYVDRAAYASFFSSTPLEDIKAENKQVYAVIDQGKKELAFALLLKSFTFKKQLMQTHFNENYVESDKYPKATFSGTYSTANNGGNNIIARGDLTLHGVTRPIEVPATLQQSGDALVGKAKFTLRPEDFNIKIPALVRDNIAKEIEVEVHVKATKK